MCFLCADARLEDKAEEAAEESESYLETLHFFGVFDGHGGAEAALHCAQTLHQRIAEALAATIDPEADETSHQGGRCPALPHCMMETILSFYKYSVYLHTVLFTLYTKPARLKTIPAEIAWRPSSYTEMPAMILDAYLHV